MSTVSAGTVWQQNASAFAATPPNYIDQERHAAVSDAMKLIRAGRPGFALYRLARSVELQNRIAGGGTVSLHVCPACGSVCTHQGGDR